jgi:hypothetical protein
MTRLAFFTFGILQEEFGHPRLRAFEEGERPRRVTSPE